MKNPSLTQSSRKVPKEQSRKKAERINLEKRAQANGNGATLIVLLLLGLIIMFSLFISPSERNHLLNISENTTPSPHQTVIPPRPSAGTLILSKVPGQLFAQPSNQRNIPISSIYLTSSTQGTQFIQVNQLKISSSDFSSTPQTIYFNIKEPNSTNNVYLSFNTEKNDGDLSLQFNQNPLFTGHLEKGSLKTPLKLTNLKKTNTLTLKVTSPGWRFWATNSYILDNIVVAGNTENKARLNGTVHAYIDESDIKNIRQSYFTYYADCDQNLIGKVKIKINNNLITYAEPACSSLNQIPINPNTLNSGVNYVYFESTKGNIKFDKIAVQLKYSNEKHPTYYFHLTPSQLTALKDNKLKIKLYLDFVGTGNSLTLNIDNTPVKISTNLKHYELDITPYINNMNSFIEITPRSNINIYSLQVYLK